jgi:hypothetical protein
MAQAFGGAYLLLEVESILPCELAEPFRTRRKVERTATINNWLSVRNWWCLYFSHGFYVDKQYEGAVVAVE